MSSEYSALAAKLKAMYSRFLTDKDYEELLSKKSVIEICAYLKATDGYSDALEGVNELNIHRGTMELMLEQDIMDEYVRLYSFVDKSKRDLLRFWFVGREVEFLKREIRYIYTHEERDEGEINQGKFEAFFETHTKINRSVMLSASSLADCAEACAQTPYGELLRRAENLGLDFFAIGMMLDCRRYELIWKAAHKRLKGEQIKLFEELIGVKTDMYNLMWIYRGKKYYGFDSDIIFANLIPVIHRIDNETLKTLVNTPDAGAFTALAKQLTPYGELFESLDGSRFIEENFRRIYYRLSKRMFVNHSESLVAAFAYLNLKEVELNNITTITEGVRYGLNNEAIRAHVGL